MGRSSAVVPLPAGLDLMAVLIVSGCAEGFRGVRWVLGLSLIRSW